MNSLGINKTKHVVNKPKFKVKTISLEDDESKQPLIDLKALKKKNLVNTDAVASIYNIKSKQSDNFYNDESGPKYSVDHIEQLKTHQHISNKTVSNYIKTSSKVENQELSDSDFEESEKKKMADIIKIRHKKKLDQEGLSMNTKKEEFLAPKDVHMAEEDVQELKDGIDMTNLYTMNTDRNDVVLEDFGDGESWINNQIQNALGTGSHEHHSELIQSYSNGATTNALADTSEMRSIKYSMNKEVEDYTTDLDYEVVRMQKSTKKNEEMLESILKGVEIHEKDIEKATESINQDAPRFQILMEFNEIIEDIGQMLDEKDDQIDHIFQNLILVVNAYLENINNPRNQEIETYEEQPTLGLGSRKKGLGFKTKIDIPQETNNADNIKNALIQELEKDILAARSTLNDLMMNVNNEFQNPSVLFSAIEEKVYSNYSSTSSFPFDFDLEDMIDFTLPYLKLTFIQTLSCSHLQTCSGKSTSSFMNSFLLTQTPCFQSFISALQAHVQSSQPQLLKIHIFTTLLTAALSNTST